MSNTHTFHITVEKGTHVDEFLMAMKEAFIKQFGEDSREQINQELMCHLVCEHIVNFGMKETEEFLDELKKNVKEAWKSTLH